MLGIATDSKKGDRLLLLHEGQQYLQAYLTVITHYNDEEEEVILPKALQELRKMLADPAVDQGHLRTVTIANEKARMALAKELTPELVVEAWRRSKRELLLKLLTLQCYEAVKALKLVRKEVEMLEEHKKIHASEESRKEYEEACKKPIPKLKFWKL